jgi:2-isopropylmalate synthase
VIANPLCYEIMTPESVGVPGNNLVLGKHSGRHALSKRLAELGYKASGPELDSVYKRFMKLAESKKKIYDQDLLSLVPMATRERAAAHATS